MILKRATTANFTTIMPILHMYCSWLWFCRPLSVFVGLRVWKKEGKEIFYRAGKGQALLQVLVCVGLCDLQMFLPLYVQQFYFFLVTCK